MDAPFCPLPVQAGIMHVRKHPTCSCARSCRCGWPTPWEKSTSCLISCSASPLSGWSRNGNIFCCFLIGFGSVPDNEVYDMQGVKVDFWPLFNLLRYMQSFVELLDYENRKPEDPHTLNEWVNTDFMIRKVKKVLKVCRAFWSSQQLKHCLCSWSFLVLMYLSSLCG